MKGLFIDTSAWYPLADRGHPDHVLLARTLRDQVRHGARIVTTNVVVGETLDGLPAMGDEVDTPIVADGSLPQ